MPRQQEQPRSSRLTLRRITLMVRQPPREMPVRKMGSPLKPGTLVSGINLCTLHVSYQQMRERMD